MKTYKSFLNEADADDYVPDVDDDEEVKGLQPRSKGEQDFAKLHVTTHTDHPVGTEVQFTAPSKVKHTPHTGLEPEEKGERNVLKTYKDLFGDGSAKQTPTRKGDNRTGDLAPVNQGSSKIKEEVELEEALSSSEQRSVEAYIKKIVNGAPKDIKSLMVRDSKGVASLVNQLITHYMSGLSEEVELDEGVKEHKGVAYFKDRKDAVTHMKKFSPKGRVVSYERGHAVQTRISGPYLNKTGTVSEEVELEEAKSKFKGEIVAYDKESGKAVKRFKSHQYTAAKKFMDGSNYKVGLMDADVHKREMGESTNLDEASPNKQTSDVIVMKTKDGIEKSVVGAKAVRAAEREGYRIQYALLAPDGRKVKGTMAIMKAIKSADKINIGESVQISPDQAKLLNNAMKSMSKSNAKSFKEDALKSPSNLKKALAFAKGVE